MTETTLQEVEQLLKEKLIYKRKRLSPAWKGMTRRMDDLAKDENATDDEYDAMHDARFEKEKKIRATVMELSILEVIDRL